MLTISPTPFYFLEEGDTEAEGHAGRRLTICDADDNDLAQVFSRDDSTVPTMREQAIGNARLFAAAPELYEALRFFGTKIEIGENRDYWLTVRLPRETIIKARAAIAKVTA